MDFFTNIGIEAIPAIAVICFLIGEAIKLTPLDEKWIPVICGFCGGGLGVVAMYTMPEFPVTNVLEAIAVGIVSGLAATGAHQVWKQLTKKGAHEE
jgi:H+/Cl- antiporter ClcA